MSDEIINDLANIHPALTSELVPLVSIHGDPAGTIQQSQIHSTHDWMRYVINFDLLSQSEAQTVMQFMQAMLGTADNFLYKDEFGPGHYQVARQTIGTGDGADATWQLYETVTSGSTSRNFNRWDILTSAEGTAPSIWVAGVLKTETTHYTIDYKEGGVVTFTGGNIPTGGQNIEAQFEFFRRCRFTGDMQDIYRAYNAEGFRLAFTEEGI